MKKRSTEILQWFLKNPNEELSLKKLTDDCGIAEEILKGDVQELVEFVRESGFGHSVYWDNYILRLDDRKYISGFMGTVYSMDPYQYEMPLEERKVYIIVELPCHNGYYSMQQLADELYVTKNTVINDCRLVGEYVKKYRIIFAAKSKKGILLQTEGGKARGLLIDIFKGLTPSIKCEKDFFTRFIIRRARFVCPLTDVIYYMNCFTKDNNIIFVKDAFFEIAIYIFVLLNRLEQTGFAENSTEPGLPQLQLDTIGNMIRCVAEELGYSAIRHNGILAMERQIPLRNLHPQIQSINDSELYGVIRHFLLEIGREIDVDVQSDNLLVESLTSHVKGMNNWNDVDYDWDIRYGTSGKFPHVRELAKDKFCIPEKYLQYSLTSKMKDSITVHVCAALLRRRKNSSPPGVIIPCPGSMVTSKYLEAQTKNYFNFYVVDTMATRQVEALKGCFDQADLAISTVPIQDCVLLVVVVSPLITVEDINKIQNLALKQKKIALPGARERFPVLSKIYVIHDSGDWRKIEYLDRELKQILEDAFYVESKIGKELALLNVLKIKYIKARDGRMTWREAMKATSEDLVRDGYFGGRYMREAIGNVGEYGSYITINKGIASVHARKESGVYEDGPNLLVSKDGILFDEGETVHLLSSFSQKGETSYLDLLKETIKLGKDQNDADRVKNLTDSMEIYHTMWEVLSRN